MTVTATKGFQRAVFTWNEDLTELTYSAMNIENDQIDELLANKVHEGCDFDGWLVTIA